MKDIMLSFTAQCKHFDHYGRDAQQSGRISCNSHYDGLWNPCLSHVCIKSVPEVMEDKTALLKTPIAEKLQEHPTRFYGKNPREKKQMKVLP